MQREAKGTGMVDIRRRSRTRMRKLDKTFDCAVASMEDKQNVVPMVLSNRDRMTKKKNRVQLEWPTPRI